MKTFASIEDSRRASKWPTSLETVREDLNHMIEFEREPPLIITSDQAGRYDLWFGRLEFLLEGTFRQSLRHGSAWEDSTSTRIQGDGDQM